MFYVVAYDIGDDKRRKKVSDILEGYGVRVNYSVFEIECNNKELKKLIELLIEIVKKEDNIRFYYLNKNTLKKSFSLN